MNILARYTLKFLRLNRKRTGITILGVILSSALICGVILLGASMQRMMIDNVISNTGNYHAMFLDVPFEKVKYITQHSEVKTALLKGDTRLGMAEGSQNPAKPYLYLTPYDEGAMENLPVDLIRGRLPQKPDEIVISQLFTVETGKQLQPGDEIQISFGTRASIDGVEMHPYTPTKEGEVFTPSQTTSYTIVGIIESTFEENISAYPGYSGITYLDQTSLSSDDPIDVGILLRNPYRIYSTVPEIANNAGLTNISLDRAQTDTIILRYNDDLLQWMGIKNNLQFTVFFVGVLGFMIVLVVAGSGLVIYNAFAISINERKKQFGMLASTGATARQIRQAVMFEALVIGAIGIPLGVISGIVGVGITLAYVQDIVSALTGVDQGMVLIVSPLIILLTVVFSAAMILFSAWAPARRAAKVSPIDAIRLSEETFVTPRNISGISSLTRRIFGFEGELALKSIWRDRKRFRTTIFSLMISIILFVVFNSMRDYTSVSARMYNQSTNYDLSVILSGSESEVVRFVDQAVKLPQVQAYSYRRCITGQVQVSRDKLTSQADKTLTETNQLILDEGMAAIPVDVCAFGQLEYERYRQSLGISDKEISSSNDLEGILVNRNKIRKGKLYEFDMLKLEAGESLEISLGPSAQNETPDRMSFSIVATAETVPLGAVSPSAKLILVVADAVFDHVMSLANIQNTELDYLFFKTDDVINLTREVNLVYSTTVGTAFSYYSPQEINQRDRMMESMIDLFFYGFLSLITLVGITNMINTVDTNLQLRRREFAMLRSAGLTIQGFHRILRFESLFYSLATLILALPIAFGLSVVLYGLFAMISNVNFTLPWKHMLIAAAGIFLIVYITMTASGSRISKDNIVAAINEENL